MAARLPLIILIILSLLLLFNLGRADMLGDESINAFRAAGLVDFTSSILQTTPYDWFSVVPWWVNLSNHDHPLMYFLLGRASMGVLGLNAWAARLPSVLAGIGILSLIFFYLRRRVAPRMLTLILVIVAGNDFFWWAHRTAFLEGVAAFWSILAIFSFLRGLEKPRWFFLMGAALGGALLTKYTTGVIAISLLLSALFWFRAQTWKKKEWWGGFLLTVIIFSPVIIYNIMMYRTRGHFDLQFSQLFHQNISRDWPLIHAEVVGGGAFSAVRQLLSTLRDSYTFPYFIILTASLVLAVVAFIKKWIKEDDERTIVLTMIVSVILLASLGAGRHLALLSTIIILAILVGLKAVSFAAQKKNPMLASRMRKPLVVIFSAVVALEMIVTLFLHLAPNHAVAKIFPKIRPHYAGFYELGKFLDTEFHGKKPAIDFGELLGDKNLSLKQKILAAGFRKDGEPDKRLIVYDDRLDWTATLWTFELRRFYLGFPTFDAEDMSRYIERDPRIGNLNLPTFYIAGTHALYRETAADQYASNMNADIEKKAIAAKRPMREIKNFLGETVFRVYEL
ncbi:MAG: hypothetical protein HW383_695 [Candidatus Magasanikbacteria bacterium]|nr:hypothetical protein [Candidatus Magasanikbacteria bacterium]